MTEFFPMAEQPMYLNAWYLEKDSNQAASALLELLNILKAERAYIDRRYRRAIELYENVQCGNLVAWQYMTQTDTEGVYQYNLVESIIDTIHAEIITNRTRPQFFTDGGDFESKERARHLTSFISGLFSDNSIYSQVAPRVCLDALVFGTGFAKVWEEEGEVKADRCFPPDVIVDDNEAALSNGKPRNMYYVRHLPRETVYALFEHNEEALLQLKTQPGTTLDSYNVRTHLDIMTVVEAWHLKGGVLKKGRHLISCGNVCLLDEEYDHSYFPFVVLRYKERMKGWLGKGIPEILEGQQELINDLRDKINAQIVGSSPFIWTQPGSKLTESEISNRIFRVIESETEPKYVAYNSVPPDLFHQFDREVNDAGQMVGANSLMMKSELPAGLNSGSGRALRIYNDTKSKRYMRFARAFESFHINLAQMMMRICDVVVDSGESDIETTYEYDGFLKKVSYRDIRIKHGNYIIKAQPVNFLSDTPSGRLSDIEALASIFPDEMKMQLVRLLDNPDIKSLSNYLASDEESISKACSLILRGEKTAGEVAPNMYMNLGMCLDIGRRVFLEAQTAGANEDNLIELESWLAMAKSLLEASMAPPPAPDGQDFVQENEIAALNGAGDTEEVVLEEDESLPV